MDEDKEAADDTIVGRVEITRAGWMDDDWEIYLFREVHAMYGDLRKMVQGKREIEEMTDGTGH